ncbi:hypothetical protein CRE_29236 [Caenorhabditis remanei]|uniref:SPK domain-containing protein n=1 Tax=Caenorhabditis remanei TaxID=31234 RepID=E3NKY8_CAERE|nr:hypothetical protein CRE_29236 [Caenorhabditis remanei]
MSKRHERLTTGVILNRVQRKRKRVKTAAVNSTHVYAVFGRIIEYRVKIHELENMDEETKIRMIFALSAPIDSSFLVKIKESDDVQTDHARRSTEYTTKENGFELKGTYLWPHYLGPSKDICIRLPATTSVLQTPTNQWAGQPPIKMSKE